MRGVTSLPQATPFTTLQPPHLVEGPKRPAEVLAVPAPAARVGDACGAGSVVQALAAGGVPLTPQGRPGAWEGAPGGRVLDLAWGAPASRVPVRVPLLLVLPVWGASLTPACLFSPGARLRPLGAREPGGGHGPQPPVSAGDEGR